MTCPVPCPLLLPPTAARLLLNYYSHLPLPLIKLVRPTAAAASSRVAYTLTGFFKSKLITISREQRHSHARAGRGRQTGSRRGEAGGEEQRVDGKINFPSGYCASPRSVVGWMDDRRTNRTKSTIAIVLLHFFVDDFSSVAVAVHNG